MTKSPRANLTEGEIAKMSNNGVVINSRTAISVGLVVAIVSALVGSAVTWGKMQGQLCAKLDSVVAERDFVRKTELSRQLDSIEARLARLEDKIDRLLTRTQADALP
jgi:uncharacterized protein HemX